MNDKEIREREGLKVRIENFLETACSTLSLDDPEDRATCAKNLSDWIYVAQVQENDMTQRIIPRATYRSGLRVVDETNGQHIFTLILEREKMMTDGDWLQMQNFLWAVLGRHIVDSPDLQRTMRAAGIQIYFEDIFGGGSQSAPMM